MNRKQFFKNQQSGRSMIEMLGVLAIMGIITVGAIAMISVAMRNQKRTSVNDEVSMIVTGVRAQFGGFDDFSGINPNIVFAQIGVSQKNPFGGNYRIETNPENIQQFVLTIDGLNQSDCLFFAGRAWIDSVGYQMSDGRFGGATATPSDCSASSGQNVVRIIYN
ncbi:MAG: hypothetical protein FWE52_04120 [Alphaproteobacteria bacterium]|nr:hypothetical protein [Alphaproteobacteria bacterium]